MTPLLWAAFGTLAVIGLALVGVALRQRARMQDWHPERPETKPEDRPVIARQAVVLAIDMCRRDGHIDEIELAAINRFLADATHMGVDDPEAMVGEVMRATTGVSVVAQAVKAVRNRADNDHRRWVLDLLIAVARADGELDAGEVDFFLHVARHFGWFPEDARDVFALPEVPAAESGSS